MAAVPVMHIFCGKMASGKSTLGMSIVLGFSANTIKQRKWLLEIINKSQASYLLHYIVASDELCKKQLKQRSKNMVQGLHSLRIVSLTI